MFMRVVAFIVVLAHHKAPTGQGEAS